MRSFWIDIKKEGDGVRIDVGKGTETTGFMSRSWNSNPYNSWPPTQVAFAAWLTKVDYKFCLKNQPGKKYLQKPSLNLVILGLHYSHVKIGPKTQIYRMGRIKSGLVQIGGGGKGPLSPGSFF